ncbi:hypothetical protein HALG_00042 [Halorubrum virus CGphi46]|uniref:Uncharacterized protein n=1 Tax=Halorubrum virus CGphi46 TaxID=754066 RepID=R9TNX0_9CAUD|nr:hypothetical protein HALG_00042 [Halorubrum virus CGphi46]AGN33830.1 hypothetical protein HALG_00042 [Halorubrum virus CGphi46]
MLEHQLIDTLSRIALENAQLIAPAIALLLLLAAQRWLGRWPDLWRFRRAALPIVDRLADGDYDEQLDVVDDRVGADLEALAEQLPEKTGLPLQARELAGTMDAPPAVVREELLGMERVWPNTLASIQYTVDEAGERVYEVGSYAFRPQGFLGSWQYHVRLTPADDGRKTRLWAHYERSAWRHPVQHYRGEGWDADEGVRWVASVFASDERFEASERARELLGE